MRGRWDRWQLFHGFIVVDCFHRFGIEGEVQVPSVGKWLLERALGGHLGWNPHRHVLLETVERLDNRFRWYQPSDAALKKKVFDAIDERRLFVVRTRARSLHASPAPARKSASVGETTSAPPRVIHWIGIEVETSDGSDFGGLYRLELPGGQHESGRLGRGNKLRLEDIHPGTARLSFTVPGVRDNVYTLQATDCILSIARDAAVPWKEIWDHPKNEKLRERRASPHVLQAGDQVFIPPFEAEIATDEHHVFQVAVPKAHVDVRLANRGRPRAGIAYTLVLDDGTELEGTTDADGRVHHEVTARVKTASLVLHGERGDEMYTVELGRLDPDEEHEGLVQRLGNLGYESPQHGGSTDETAEALRQVLARFQADHQLETTGEADRTTLNKLRERHGA